MTRGSCTASVRLTRAGASSVAGLGAACGGTGRFGIQAKYFSMSFFASAVEKSPLMTSDAFDGT